MPPVRMSYRAVGSSTGQYEFLGNTNASRQQETYVPYSDFGAGDIPFDADDYAALSAAGREFAHFPFLLGAMSFFHNVPDVPKSGVGAINMTACMLAKVFDRQITTWDDAEILAINPMLDVPAGQEIRVYHRVHGSSTTSGITTYLNAACPSIWTADMVGKTVDWKAGTFDAEGSSNMAAYLATDPYSIGYIDSGHGHGDGLKEIELENAAGTFQTSLQAMAREGVGLAASQALSAGVLPSDPTASFADVSFHNQLGDFTWPIVAVSYLYFDLNQTMNGDKGPLLKAMLEYIISDEGQELVESYGFIGIPSAVKTLAQDAIDLINLPADQPTWSHELASTTQKGAGMMPYVISGKRKSWYYYQIGELDGTTEDVATTLLSYATATDVTALQAEVDKLNKDKASTSDVDTLEELLIFAYVALIFGFVSLIFSLYLYFLITSSASSNGSPPVQEVQMTGVAGAESGNGKHSQI